MSVSPEVGDHVVDAALVGQAAEGADRLERHRERVGAPGHGEVDREARLERNAGEGLEVAEGVEVERGKRRSGCWCNRS